MKLFEHPLTYYYYENKFVITEDRAYFVPYRRELDWPIMRDILAKIFDLDDPDVVEVVDGRFSEGRIIVGYYYPSTNEVVIQVPLETSEYTENRIKVVFGSE